MGYQQLWMLKAALDEPLETIATNQTVAQEKRTG